MIEFGHKASGTFTAVLAAWAWLGENANSITAACAILGVLVNVVFAILKYCRRQRSDDE